ncbi:hypothetical protein D6D24_04950 [Aureobasidium pullulans]|uniref:SMODS and SLOG-associating 2TM effector domain-containing protein n=1 Tax=Aureobasidium pullulans TaxID=5580 RepID=A0A4S8VSY6_AURPU|nr:hypothetical protein D6D24_04950 [Aureobasidium pullulans]
MDEEAATETDPLLSKHPAVTRRRVDAPIPDNIPISPQPTPNNNGQDNDSEPLSRQEIYTLLGMAPPTANNTTPRHLESAHGFYSQLLKAERRAARQYRLYDAAVIFLMIIQLCISAVFVVLGSLPNLDRHHVAVASLGAIGTVVAGMLALMRGQGLPNRLRMERDALRRVVFETEELYWDARADRDIDFGDIERLRDAFVAVVEDARKNHPDVWTHSPVPVRIKTGLSGKGTLLKPIFTWNRHTVVEPSNLTPAHLQQLWSSGHGAT